MYLQLGNVGTLNPDGYPSHPVTSLSSHCFNINLSKNFVLADTLIVYGSSVCWLLASTGHKTDTFKWKEPIPRRTQGSVLYHEDQRSDEQDPVWQTVFDEETEA